MIVSVVMPVFNALATLPRALASIERQAFTDWELIAIDDGSSDGSGKWLEERARKDPRIQVLRRPRAGLVAALNAGLEHAKGEFIARMDADDECLPSRLAEQVAFLRQEPEIGLVGSLVAFCGDPIAQAGYAAHVDWLNSVTTPAEIECAQFIESPFAHPSVMFRADLLGRFGGYRDGEFPEDYELWLRWLAAGVRMTKVPRVLLNWHDSPGRLSRNDPRYSPEAFFRLKASYLDAWLERHVATERQLLIWGAGRLTRRRVEALPTQSRIAAYIDVDPRKQARSVQGRPVLRPDQIPAPDKAFIVGYVANRGARDLQRQYLTERGFVEGRDFVFAA